MQLINQLLRGVVIGAANIIPGVSGGTMMVSMGVYDTLIHCITHLFKEFKKSVLTLLPYAIGMVVGIVALASLLDYLFAHYALPTSTAFIGMILGGLSPLVRKVSHKKLGVVSVLAFIVFFAGVIALALVGGGAEQAAAEGAQAALDTSPGHLLLMVAVGAIASATMLVPGVSGSMVLMLLGFYEPTLRAVVMLKDALLSFDFAAMAQPVLVLVPFGVGVLLGIFGVAKLIEWLLQRYPTQTYCAVLGLVLSSPIAILLRTDLTGVTLVTVLVSLATFAAGFVCAMLLARGAKEEAEPVKTAE